MKAQSLLVEKRQLEHRISTTGRNEMNCVFRRMKTCGVPVSEFLEFFPGNTFFEFTGRSRKLGSLRERINN